MSLSMTVVADSTPASPGFVVTVSGMSGVAGAATVTVQRDQTIDTGAKSDPVRGLSARVVSGDSANATDYEFTWLQTSMTYTATVYNAAGSSLATVTSASHSAYAELLPYILAVYPNATAMIRSVSIPTSSRPVVVNDFNSWNTPARTLTSLTVLGRKNPVILTDVMGGKAGSMILVSASSLAGSATASRQDFDTLLFSGDTFLFQPFYKGAQLDDMFFKPGDVSVTRPTVASSYHPLGGPSTVYDPVLLYSVAFTEVDRPLTTSETPAIGSWQQVLNSFATWNDVLTSPAFAKWLDVLNNPTGS